jgi:hypothetical protein
MRKLSLGTVGKIGASLLVCGLFASASLGAPRAGGQDTTSRDFQKTLTLPSGQTVSIEHKLGDVRIRGESGRDVKIGATIHAQAHSQEDAKRLADAIQINVSQDGQGIKVRTVYPESWDDKKKSYSVTYEIVVPMDAKLWVKNDFGNVAVAGVKGWTDVDNTHGQIDLRDSGAAKLTNSFGGVQAESIAGNLTITNSNGNVTVSNVKGALDVKDRFATITIANVQGEVTVSGANGTVVIADVGASNINESFGTISARNIRGNLVAASNNGTIEVNLVSGSAQLNGSFGQISFENVGGAVKVMSTNGRVSGRQIGGPVDVHTTFGEVALDGINGPVDVEDSNGGVSVRTIKGKATLTTSFGTISAASVLGGMRATTGNGGIHLADIGGETFAKTSFGAVHVQHIDGALTVENANGTVNAESVRGDTSVKTSFGAVTLSEIGGAISVDNQNAAILISMGRSPSCHNISAKTSFSPIRAELAEGVGYNVNVRTSSGRITTDLPVTASGTMGGDVLNGKIGNGGCALTLTNSNANIEIVKH